MAQKYLESSYVFPRRAALEGFSELRASDGARCRKGDTRGTAGSPQLLLERADTVEECLCLRPHIGRRRRLSACDKGKTNKKDGQGKTRSGTHADIVARVQNAATALIPTRLARARSR